MGVYRSDMVAALASQRTEVQTLETIAQAASRGGVHPPALLVVGSVVALRKELEWFEKLPLFGQRILVTRPRDEGSRAAPTLESLGAEVLLAPTVEVRPITDAGPLDGAIDRLAKYDWLVFTSANGVRFFLARLTARGLDLRALGHLRLAAIGTATADALKAIHLNADLVPESYRSESLAAALLEHASGRRILLARADRGRTVLKDELQHLSEVDQVAVYHNADARALPESVDRTDQRHSRHDRLDHINQPGHHSAAVRAVAARSPRSHWPRDPAGQLESCDDRGSPVPRLDRRGRSGLFHVGRPGPGGRGPRGE